MKGLRPLVTRILIGGIGTLIVAGLSLLYVQRVNHPLLYYYGASPEVPEGKAIAIFNPFRSRNDEKNAEWLIRDLATPKCDEIVRDRLSSHDASKICPVLRNNTIASLIWLEKPEIVSSWQRTRKLVYNLPQAHARLVVYFANQEFGWGVSTISLRQ
jgi:hypothetical protein